MNVGDLINVSILNYYFRPDSKPNTIKYNFLFRGIIIDQIESHNEHTGYLNMLSIFKDNNNVEHIDLSEKYYLLEQYYTRYKIKIINKV